MINNLNERHWVIDSEVVTGEFNATATVLSSRLSLI